MANHLIKKATLELVEGATKEEFDVLSDRVDSIVAGTTTNATGYDIITLTETVNQDADLIISYTFEDIPSNAVIIEATYRAAIGGHKMWKSDNLKIWQATNYIQLQVDNYTDAGIAEFKLVYSVPKPIDLDELTDIRIGYDDTVYASAGEAVRSQIRACMENESGGGTSVVPVMFSLNRYENEEQEEIVECTCNKTFSQALSAARNGTATFWLHENDESVQSVLAIADSGKIIIEFVNIITGNGDIVYFYSDGGIEVWNISPEPGPNPHPQI